MLDEIYQKMYVVAEKVYNYMYQFLGDPEDWFDWSK